MRSGHSRRWDSWPAVAVAVACLACWEIAVRLEMVPAFYFPAPSMVVRTLVEQTANGDLTADFVATLKRFLPGLALGAVPGLVLGLVMGWSRRLRSIVDPFIALVHPIPKIAILPLIMVFFGIGETSKIVMVALTAFFPVLINSMAGVRQIPEIHFEVAENYGAGVFKLFTRVVLPGSLPLVFHGLRLAVNMGLLLTIASEIAAANNGLGARIWLAWEVLRVPDVYATLIIISALGLSLTSLVHFLSRRFAPWQPERTASRRR